VTRFLLFACGHEVRLHSFMFDEVFGRIRVNSGNSLGFVLRKGCDWQRPLIFFP